VQTNVCGTGGGDFSSGPGYAIVWLGGCPGVPADQVGTHELIHALGALPAGAPHACPGDAGHPCDAPFVDILSPYTDGRPLQQQVLDVNRDDYYGHSGTWNDLQDSVWLSHLDTPQVPLTVSMLGTGRVSSDLPGLDCNIACTTQWDQGKIVTLAATPGAGLRFVRWTGACAGNSSCSITLTQAQSVTAVFGPLTIPVKVTTVGRGTVRCTPVCKRAFPAGDPVTLRAVPAKGWKFVGWSGGCKGKQLVCRPKTETALTVRATFRRK
jgi:Fe-S cluster biogenesis protein NfuA